MIPVDLILPVGSEPDFNEMRVTLTEIQKEQNRQSKVFDERIVEIKSGIEDAIENAYDIFNELIQRTEIHLTRKLSRRMKSSLKEIQLRNRC